MSKKTQIVLYYFNIWFAYFVMYSLSMFASFCQFFINMVLRALDGQSIVVTRDHDSIVGVGFMLYHGSWFYRQEKCCHNHDSIEIYACPPILYYRLPSPARPWNSKGWHWKRNLFSLEKKFIYTGKKINRPGKKIIRLAGLLVLWSSWSPGPLVLLVLWSSWSSGPPGPPGPLVLLVLWSSWSSTSGPFLLLWY